MDGNSSLFESMKKEKEIEENRKSNKLAKDPQTFYTMQDKDDRTKSNIDAKTIQSYWRKKKDN